MIKESVTEALMIISFMLIFYFIVFLLFWLKYRKTTKKILDNNEKLITFNTKTVQNPVL